MAWVSMDGALHPRISLPTPFRQRTIKTPNTQCMFSMLEALIVIIMKPAMVSQGVGQTVNDSVNDSLDAAFPMLREEPRLPAWTE